MKPWPKAKRRPVDVARRFFEDVQRPIVIERDAGRCLRCGQPGTDVHHRDPKGMGGTDDLAVHALPNLALCCRDCHGWAHLTTGEPAVAGWLLPSGRDPERTPLLVNLGWYDGWSLLTPGGTHLWVAPVGNQARDCMAAAVIAAPLFD